LKEENTELKATKSPCMSAKEFSEAYNSGRDEAIRSTAETIRGYIKGCPDSTDLYDRITKEFL
jgi:hypothetical protein